MDNIRNPMIERHCGSSADTRNVSDVIHVRGAVRSPSAQNMVQEFLNRKNPTDSSTQTKRFLLECQNFLCWTSLRWSWRQLCDDEAD